jgi:hypothetical protein
VSPALEELALLLILLISGGGRGLHSPVECQRVGDAFYGSLESQLRISSRAGRMTISFSDRVEVPKYELVRFLDNESVFLNLETEHYCGLDEIGTRMWQAVTAAPYIEAAYEQLLSQFDVEAQQLRQNFSELLERLVNDGLLRVHCANAGMDPAI